MNTSLLSTSSTVTRTMKYLFGKIYLFSVLKIHTYNILSEHTGMCNSGIPELSVQYGTAPYGNIHRKVNESRVHRKCL